MPFTTFHSQLENHFQICDNPDGKILEPKKKKRKEERNDKRKKSVFNNYYMKYIFIIVTVTGQDV